MCKRSAGWVGAVIAIGGACVSGCYRWSLAPGPGSRPRDVDLLSVSSADFTVTKRLHSRLDATVRYSSVTPVDVEGFDLELKNSPELLF